MESNKNTKKLIIELPVLLHTKLKSQAAFANVTMRTYLIRALLEKMAQEELLNK